MIPRRASLPLLAPAPSRDFPALRPVLLFTLPYRMRMAGAMLALLAASATVLGLGQGLRRLVDDGFKNGDAETLDQWLRRRRPTRCRQGAPLQLSGRRRLVQ
jgi:hypothetical protein